MRGGKGVWQITDAACRLCWGWHRDPISLRRARRDHRCDNCRKCIAAGSHYIEAVISPDHGDIGNAGWWRSHECEECATRYGRWPLAVAS